MNEESRILRVITYQREIITFENNESKADISWSWHEIKSDGVANAAYKLLESFDQIKTHSTIFNFKRQVLQILNEN